MMRSRITQIECDFTNFDREIRRLASLTYIRALLCEASYTEDACRIKSLLDAGEDINQRNGHNRTPLMCAIAGSKSDLSKIMLILDAGAAVNVKDNSGDTPLTLAVFHQKIGAIFLLQALTSALTSENVDILKNARWVSKHLNPLYVECMLMLFNIYDIDLTQCNQYLEMKKYTIYHSQLNKTQQIIIQATMNFYFDDISNLPPEDAVDVLEIMLGSEGISDEKKSKLKHINIWESISQVHAIFNHPCPENPAESYPYVGQEPGYCMVRIDRVNVGNVDNDGNIILKNGRVIRKELIVRNRQNAAYLIIKEKKGLLGLTKWEDNQGMPVTKQDVVLYIKHLILNKMKSEVDRYIAQYKSENKSNYQADDNKCMVTPDHKRSIYNYLSGLKERLKDEKNYPAFKLPYPLFDKRIPNAVLIILKLIERMHADDNSDNILNTYKSIIKVLQAQIPKSIATMKSFYENILIELESLDLSQSTHMVSTLNHTESDNTGPRLTA